MINLDKEINELDKILKNGDINDLVFFENIFINLIKNYTNSDSLIKYNLKAISLSFKLIISLYGKNSTFTDFNNLLNNKLKGLQMLDALLDLPKTVNLKGEERYEMIIWFQADYFLDMDGSKDFLNTFKDCYISRFLVNLIMNNSKNI